MPANLFIKAKITHPGQYGQYIQSVIPLIARFGGCFLTGGARPVEVLEGDPNQWGDFTLVVAEFPSVEIARSFWQSPEYAEVRKLREGSGEVHIVLTEA